MTPDKYHMPQLLGARATRRFHAMIKPAGSACNLDCTYCFYLSKDRLPQGPGPGRIEPGLNDLCAGFQRFFRHALPEVDRIVAVLRKGSS